MAAANFTNIVDFMIMMPLGPQMMRVFSIEPSEFSLLVASYSISAGISGFSGVFYMDRLDRKKALLGVYFGFLLGTLACAFAPTYETLLAARALTGVFGGVISSVIMAIIGDVFPDSKRGRAMGVTMASFSIASVVGVPFGLYLANEFTWQAPFLLLAGIGVPVYVAMTFLIPEVKSHLSKRPTKFSH